MKKGGGWRREEPFLFSLDKIHFLLKPKSWFLNWYYYKLIFLRDWAVVSVLLTPWYDFCGFSSLFCDLNWIWQEFFMTRKTTSRVSLCILIVSLLIIVLFFFLLFFWEINVYCACLTLLLGYKWMERHKLYTLILSRERSKKNMNKTHTNPKL